MGVALLLIVLALVLGGVGLAAKAAWWLFVIAAVVFIVGALSGWRARV